MVSKVVRWGNSLGLRIPSAFAREAGLQGNSQVEMSVKEGVITVRARTRRKYALDAMLTAITKSNLHGESDFGAAGTELL